MEWVDNCLYIPYFSVVEAPLLRASHLLFYIGSLIPSYELTIHGGETASTGILKLRLHTERFPVRS